MAGKITLKRQVENKIKSIHSDLANNFESDFERVYIPEIKDTILAEYDTKLVDVVTDRNSRTNPLYYRDEFSSALNDFDYVEIKNDKLTLIIPDIDNFNWNQGRLRIIKNILEGTLGVYVEVDENQYVSMYNKRPQIVPYDKTVPASERIYLLRYTADLRSRELATFGRVVLVRFPFSNIPPIDIFEGAEKLVNENIGKWMADIIKDSIKENTR